MLLPERQSEIRERALDVLQALLAEAFDGEKIILAFANEAADGADGRVVERGFDALGKREFRDARLQHLGVDGGSLLVAGARAGGVRGGSRPRAPFLPKTHD